MSREDAPPAIDVFALAERDTFVRGLGVEIVEASLGRAVSRVRIDDRHINFNGVGHGGLTFTLADAGFGYACNSPGIMSGGIDAHIVCSRSVRTGDVLTATAVEISRSSKLSNYRIDVVRAGGQLVAAMTGTACISGKPVAS